jgi:hypothetical protein
MSVATMQSIRTTQGRRLAAPTAGRVVQCHASKKAEPVVIPKLSVSGATEGGVPLSLRVAGEATARHVVHRYLVMVRQNARQVRT